MGKALPSTCWRKGDGRFKARGRGETHYRGAPRPVTCGSALGAAKGRGREASPSPINTHDKDVTPCRYVFGDSRVAGTILPAVALIVVSVPHERGPRVPKGSRNLFFKNVSDARDVEQRSSACCLREPLRRYADILAQSTGIPRRSRAARRCPVIKNLLPGDGR